MSIVLTMMVRDEIDIVACNIRYHLDQGVSHVIVTDNGSIDGTRDVLADLARSSPVTVLDQEPADFRQGAWVTDMARMAHVRFGATWVINTDADEFFVAPESTLAEVLDAIPAHIDVVRVARNDFVDFDRPRVQAPPLEMLYRKRESLNRLSGTPIAPKAVHRGASDVTVTQGCHSALSPSFGDAKAIASIVTCHYPIRSLGQFESKVRNAGSGYAINSDLPPSSGVQKRFWYGLLLEGGLADEYREHHHYGPDRLRVAVEEGELLQDLAVASRLGNDSSAPRGDR